MVEIREKGIKGEVCYLRYFNYERQLYLGSD